VDIVINNSNCNKYLVAAKAKLNTKRTEILLKGAKDRDLIRVSGFGRTPKTYRRKAFLYVPTQKGIEFIKAKVGEFI
jgi:hypothetical protein